MLQVFGGGNVEIQFIRFTNSQSKLSNGRCCDRLLLCIYACDTFFEICYQEDNFNSSHCSQKVVTSTWSNDNKIFNSGQNALGDGIPNPLTFRFQQQWSGSFSLQITVFDNDVFIREVQANLRLNVRYSLTNHTSAFVNVSDSFVTLRLLWRIVCDENYYTDCSVYCKAQNSDQEGHYTCDQYGNKVCNPGWTGYHCNIDATVCISQPCLNGGVCNVTADGFMCTCPEGFVGNTCEYDLDSCRSKPCQNGGSCHNVVNHYKCTCPEGYKGDVCEDEINECESNPCVNGECVDGIRSYSCVCNSSYTGTACNEEIDECKSNPCIRGQCMDSIGSYSCMCEHFYTGVICNEEIFPTEASRPTTQISNLSSSQIINISEKAQEREDSESNVVVYAGAGAGASLLIIIIAASLAILFYCRSKPATKDKDTVIEMSPADSSTDEAPQPIYESIKDPGDSSESPRLITSASNPRYYQVENNLLDSNQVQNGLNNEDDTEYTYVQGNRSNCYERLCHDQGDFSDLDGKNVCRNGSQDQSHHENDTENTCMDGNPKDSYNHIQRSQENDVSADNLGNKDQSLDDDEYTVMDGQPRLVAAVNNPQLQKEDARNDIFPLAEQEEYVCMDGHSTLT